MKINPVYTSLKFTFRGKWVTRGITVLLTAISLAIFSLAFTGYSYDREEYFHRAYQNMLHERKYLTFSNEISINVDSLTGLHASGDVWGRPYYSPSEVRQIEELPLGFLSVCRTDTEVQAYIDKFYFRGVKEIDGKPTAEYSEWLEEQENRPPHMIRLLSAIAGEEQAFHEFGFQLAAGRYPQAENEIAIDVGLYERFAWGGYIDAIANGGLKKEMGYYNDEYQDAYVVDYDVQPPEENGIAISSYQDILGKTLATFMPFQAPELLESHMDGIYPETDRYEQSVIVGVVDASSTERYTSLNAKALAFGGGCFDGNADEYGWFGQIVFHSEAWRQAHLEKGDLYTGGLIAKGPISDETLNLVLDLSKRQQEEKLAEFTKSYPYAAAQLDYYNFMIGAEGSSSLFEYGTTTAQQTSLILSGIGLIFLVFSVVLNAVLMNAVLQQAHREIGVMRALGGSRGKISTYFLIGTAFLGLVVFLVALVITLTVFYCYFGPLFAYRGFEGTSPFIFNGWNALFLAGTSLIVPVLSVLLPLRLFMRRSCVEMIKATEKGKKEK